MSQPWWVQWVKDPELSLQELGLLLAAVVCVQFLAQELPHAEGMWKKKTHTTKSTNMHEKYIWLSEFFYFFFFLAF